MGEHTLMTPSDAAAEMLRLRKGLEMSQREFAIALGVTRFAVASYETLREKWRPCHLMSAKFLLGVYLRDRYERHMTLLGAAPTTKP
jgi:DNA-binding XRE family transcriptional regulator